MVDALLRGTIYDPDLVPHLDDRSARIAQEEAPPPMEEEAHGEDASVLVSLSPHALHYLDLRILFLIRNLHEQDIGITLLLRDHQAAEHPHRLVSYPEGKARLLDVLDLLGVPQDRLEVLTWTDVASRLTLDPDLYGMLNEIDTAHLQEAVEGIPPSFRSMTEVLTTFLDVYIGSHPTYHRASWLIGGPTRYRLQSLAADAFERRFDHEAARILPLPELPYLPSLPSLLPDNRPADRGILEDLEELPQDALLRLHHGFLGLLKDVYDAYDGPWQQLQSPPEELDRMRLAQVLADGLQGSLEWLGERAATRSPRDHLRVPEGQMTDVLDALGHPRRVRVLRTLLQADEGLQAREILDALRLPDSKMTTIRRDLYALKEAGLILGKGLKPIRWQPVADRIEIRLQDHG